MRIRFGVTALTLILSLFFYGDGRDTVHARTQAAIPSGTGLAIDNVTGTSVLGDIVFDGQLVIEELALNAVGGLEVTGTIIGTVNVLGSELITQDFTTELAISDTGGNGCKVVALDLGPIGIDAVGGTAVQLEQVNLTGNGKGPVGSLLCVLGNALESLMPLSLVTNLIDAINRLL
jgi:hypothetical protein